MISKNSFWVRLRQNARRRSWCLLADVMSLFLALPVTTLIAMNQIKRFDYNALEEKKELYNTAMDLLGTNVGLSVLVFLLAVISGIQGFSYLHDRKKVDMYHSQPVSDRQRFFSIWLNGILAFLGTYLLCMLLSWCEVAAFGVLDSEMMLMSLIGLSLNLVFFLAVYAVTCCAVMLTGNRITCVLGSIVLLFYGAASGVMLAVYQNVFFMTSNTGRSEFFDRFPARLSVIGFWISLSEEHSLIYQDSRTAGEVASAYGTLYLVTAAIAVAGTLLSYYLFCKRKGEMTSVSMSFPVTKGLIEVMISVPVAMLSGYIVGDMVGTIFFYLLGILLGMIVSHTIVQCIYEADIKMVFKTWKVFAAGTAATVLILLGFLFDVFGYDSYIPDAEKLESAAISLENYSEYIDLDSLESGQNYASIMSWDYIRKNMYFKDVTLIEQLAGANYFADEGKSAKMRIRAFLNKDAMFYSYDREKDYITVNVLYRFKNGSEEERCLYIDREQQMELLNQIAERTEYKNAVFEICDERIAKKWKYKGFQAKIDDYLDTYAVSQEQMAGLREAYMKDLEFYNYEKAACENAVAEMKIEPIDGSEWPVYTCYIYKDYANTLEYLAKEQIYNGADLVKHGAESIQIIKYREIEGTDGEESALEETEGEETGEEESQRVYPDSDQESVTEEKGVEIHTGTNYRSVTYTDPEKIRQLLQLLEVSIKAPCHNTNDRGPDLQELSIMMDDGISMSFKEGAQLPEFVKKDLEMPQSGK